MVGDISDTLESVKNTVTDRLTAKTAFGEPVTADGVTVIPVARVVLGFGAGGGVGEASSGNGDAPAPAGGGGGGGGAVQPLGFIEVSGTGSRWVPLEPAPAEIALRALTIAAVMLPFGGRRGLLGRLLLLLIGQAVAGRLARPSLPSMPEGMRFGRAFGEQSS